MQNYTSDRRVQFLSAQISHRGQLNERHSLLPISAISYTIYRSLYSIISYRIPTLISDYVHSHVDLGVTINHKLNWNVHCEKLVNKASSQLGLLIRTCHFTTIKKQKKTFYLTIVRSIFEHCSIIWRPRSSNQIFKFDAIQKRQLSGYMARALITIVTWNTLINKNILIFCL